jgi:phosphoenolpyruvate carboxykinase (GTP)
MALQRHQVAAINPKLVAWVDEVAGRTKPDSLVWCDGSDEENRLLIKQMLEQGKLIELDESEFANCYLYRSNPNDVARTESSTFICTDDKNDAGPTNNWMQTATAQKTLWEIFDGCMKGRTMYVVQYVMGQIGSPYAQFGIQITDSRYVVISLRIMTKMGAVALEEIGGNGDFVRGIHSLGTLDPARKYICHFPDAKLIMSINSNYGGNALLSKKAHALRIASVSARKEGWMAEHMLITGVQDEHGDVTYITGAFPSASGKTNLAMLKPPPKYNRTKVLLVGDDISWLHMSSDGKLYAINPEAGFFCVAPHTNPKTNPNLMETIRKNTIFTNVALTRARTPWWEGKEPFPDSSSSPILDWQGREWKPGGSPAAHPNSRFTVSVSQYPCLSPKYSDPNGVPISAILFGGRRASLVPLVYEAFSWEHGVLMGAMMNVETTAAAEGNVGVLKRDPMAMIPFCGYNMGDYFQHWLSFSSRSKKLPRIFQVNWFRAKDKKFLWPGYGENIRVLKWIIDRVKGRVGALETPIGYVPLPGSIDTEGLDLPNGTMEELLHVDAKGWLSELSSVESFFKTFGDRFPQRLWQEYRDLVARLQQSD